MLSSYKDLIVWKKSIELVKEVYVVTKNFPKDELYGLSSQMRRAAISIPSNIAEGYTRRGRNEYIQFLSIAKASGAELETQIIISRELFSKHDYKKAESLLEEIQKMLYTQVKNLSSTLNPSP